jgi:hypothetical protein
MGNYQKPSFWVVGEINGTIELVSDVQLIDLLRSSNLAKLFLMMGSFEGEETCIL